MAGSVTYALEFAGNIYDRPRFNYAAAGRLQISYRLNMMNALLVVLGASSGPSGRARSWESRPSRLRLDALTWASLPTSGVLSKSGFGSSILS